MYMIERQGDLYRIECEEHGESYPGWRTFEQIPQKVQKRLAIVQAATSGVNCGNVDGVGEKVSATEYLIY
ncbi:hypothetical protein [Noviherbaspirillum saxi]|uniref:Uncharacterized protein n=1 Tax=Noviherbaspirillum saxi TaxID=2320863 RepID=A0A3A3FJD7_9BURK|nr:hypothetical protein [Noviherbaspirillum saxi]RJF92674.1 hypothetical protein D3871_29270 [Noviherbaspirillum saxi]